MICKHVDLPLDSKFQLQRKSDNLIVLLNPKDLPDQLRPNKKDGQYIIKVQEAEGSKINRLREKNESQLKELATALNMHYCFGPAADSSFGNALLSRFQIKTNTNILYTLNNEETRAILKVELDHPEFSVICVTHLDYKTETNRMTQLQFFLDQLHSEKCVILGDFNSLTKGDYSDSFLEKMANERKNSNWEIPQYQISEIMQKNRFIDCWKVINPLSIDPGTCIPYNTRIDYIWSKNISYNLTSCEIRNDLSGSDHYPIVAEFQQVQTL